MQTVAPLGILTGMAGRVELSPVEESARRVLEALQRLYGYTDSEMASFLGLSRGGAQAKRTGDSKISLKDLMVLCNVFGVGEGVFQLDPEEAVLEAIEARPGVLSQRIAATGRKRGCFTAVESLVRKLTDRAENHSGAGLCPAA